MIVRLLSALLALFALVGCESLPKASYTTSTGCGIAQWTSEFVNANVTSMTWSGPCVSGLAQGKGELVVNMTGNRQRLYSGQMEKGFIHGDGTYKREDGWKYQGNFLWITFTGGKVFIPSGQLIFDGLMMHNEKYQGQNLVYANQRYHTGKLYWHDNLGTTIEDGRFTGSSGPELGFTSVNVVTGAGLIFGKVIQNGRVVARWVEGRNYADDIAYMNAQTRYFQNYMAALNNDNEAYLAQQRAAAAEDRRQTIAALGGALSSAAGGQNTAERLQLANNSLNQSLAGGSGASEVGGNSPYSGGGSSGAGNSGIEISGSMKHCLKVVPASDDPSVSTTGINANNGLKYNYVIVNTCNEDIQYEYCRISGGKNYKDGKVTETRFGCESLYGGSSIARSGKLIRQGSNANQPPWDRYRWIDRQMLIDPQSWFVCNAKTEQIRLINRYGRTLEGNRQCIPRRGNPYVPIWPVEEMIPAGG